MVTKEMFAAGLAETAWGQIVLWNLAGKIQGNLSYEEFRKPLEARFLEAIERRENDCGSGKEKAGSTGGDRTGQSERRSGGA